MRANRENTPRADDSKNTQYFDKSEKYRHKGSWNYFYFRLGVWRGVVLDTY